MRKKKLSRVGKVRYSNCLFTSIFIYVKFWRKNPKIHMVYFSGYWSPHFLVEVQNNTYSFCPLRDESLFGVLCFQGYISVKRKSKIPTSTRS